MASSGALPPSNKRGSEQDPSSDAAPRKKLRVTLKLGAPTEKDLQSKSDLGDVITSEGNEDDEKAGAEGQDDSENESNDDDGDHDDDDDDDDDDGLATDVKERLDDIRMHVEDLTSYFLRMIFKEFKWYMGPRSGNRAVAAGIVEHCVGLAHEGSDLRKEKQAVKEAYKMCYGSCYMTGDSEEEEEED